MKYPTVKISNDNNNPNCFIVELVNTLGITICKLRYWNFIDYGDKLTRAISEWIDCGCIPEHSVSGLEKLDN